MSVALNLSKSVVEEAVAFRHNCVERVECFVHHAVDLMHFSREQGSFLTA